MSPTSNTPVSHSTSRQAISSLTSSPEAMEEIQKLQAEVDKGMKAITLIDSMLLKAMPEGISKTSPLREEIIKSMTGDKAGKVNDPLGKQQAEALMKKGRQELDKLLKQTRDFADSHNSDHAYQQIYFHKIRFESVCAQYKLTQRYPYLFREQKEETDPIRKKLVADFKIMNQAMTGDVSLKEKVKSGKEEEVKEIEAALDAVEELTRSNVEALLDAADTLRDLEKEKNTVPGSEEENFRESSQTFSQMAGGQISNLTAVQLAKLDISVAQMELKETAEASSSTKALHKELHETIADVSEESYRLSLRLGQHFSTQPQRGEILNRQMRKGLVKNLIQLEQHVHRMEGRYGALEKLAADADMHEYVALFSEMARNFQYLKNALDLEMARYGFDPRLPENKERVSRVQTKLLAELKKEKEPSASSSSKETPAAGETQEMKETSEEAAEASSSDQEEMSAEEMAKHLGGFRYVPEARKTESSPEILKGRLEHFRQNLKQLANELKKPPAKTLELMSEDEVKKHLKNESNSLALHQTRTDEAVRTLQTLIRKAEPQEKAAYEKEIERLGKEHRKLAIEVSRNTIIPNGNAFRILAKENQIEKVVKTRTNVPFTKPATEAYPETRNLYDVYQVFLKGMQSPWGDYHPHLEGDPVKKTAYLDANREKRYIKGAAHFKAPSQATFGPNHYASFNRSNKQGLVKTVHHSPYSMHEFSRICDGLKETAEK